MRKKLAHSVWLWGLAAAILFVLLIAVIGLHYTSPATVRRLVVENASKALNGNVRVGNARVQILRGVELQDIRVYSTDKDNPEMSIGRLRCDWDPAAFLHGDIEPRRLVAVRPRLRLTLDEKGATNLDSFFRPSPDAERNDREPFDPTSFERYFSEGVYLESGEALWGSAFLFGEARPRLFTGLDCVMRRSSETLYRWDVHALLRDPPLTGTRIEGWMDLTPKNKCVLLRFAADELQLTPEMLSYLPVRMRRALSRFALSGTGGVNAFIDYRQNAPFAYAVEINARNVDARLRDSGVTVRGLNGRLRFDPAGLSADDVSGIVWQGALQGGAVRRAAGRGTAWLKIDQADLAQLANECGLDKRELRGTLNASARFRFGAERGASWKAEGTVSVGDAFLAKLPVFARAFALLNFRFPGGEVFDRGECKFSIREGKIYVERLSVSSPSVEIGGTGAIGLDGDADLVLVFASSDREKGSVLTRPFRAVIHGIERGVMPPVAVTGPISNPKVRVLTLEPITRQLRDLADLLPFVKLSGKKTKNGE